MNYATILAMMAALLTIGCTPEHAASYYAPAIDTNDQPSREITGVLEELEFSGSILVGKKEEIILRQAVNAWPTEDVQPVNSDSRFPIASMTKSFTACPILRRPMRVTSPCATCSRTDPAFRTMSTFPVGSTMR